MRATIVVRAAFAASLLCCLTVAPGAAADGVDLFVFGEPVLAPGALGSLRVVVRQAADLLGGAALAEARVTIALSGGAGGDSVLFDGATDGSGTVEPLLRAPEHTAPQAELVVRVRTSFGIDEVRRALDLRPRLALLLAPERSVFAPGQAVRLMALARELDTGRPAAGAVLRLQVGEEGRGCQAETVADRLGAAWLACTAPPGVKVAPVRVEAGGDFRGAAELGGGEQSKSAPEAAGGLRLELRPTGGAPVVGRLLRARAETGEPSACLFDLRRAGRTLRTRAAVPVDGFAEVDFALTAEMAGELQVLAYQIGPAGRVVVAQKNLWVEPAEPMRLLVAREQAVYRPGERVELLVRSQQPQPLAVAALVLSPTQGAEPKAWPDWAPATGARTTPAPDPWGDPLAERRQRAAADLPAIREALRQQASRAPVAAAVGPGRWAYRPDLVAEIVQGGSLPAERAIDPLGRPYDVLEIEALWPELRASRMLPKLQARRRAGLRAALYDGLRRHLAGGGPPSPERVQQALAQVFVEVAAAQPFLVRDEVGDAEPWEQLKGKPGFSVADGFSALHAERVERWLRALQRYGEANESWYRRSLLDRERGAFDYPADALSRLVRRGSLAPGEERDLWGRPVQVRSRSTERMQWQVDPRLRFVDLVSAGPDGRWDTADDLHLSSGFESVAPAATRPAPLPVATSAPVAAPSYGRLLQANSEGQDGWARLQFELPAGEGVWRVFLLAQDNHGQFARAGHRLRVEAVTPRAAR